MGVCGVALNYLIAVFYGAATLGAFNQVFSLYIFFSQLLVLGVHLSAQKYVSEYGVSDTAALGTIAYSALTVCLVQSIIGGILFWLAADLFGRLLSSPDVTAGIKQASIGLFFFSINKVLLAIANGYRHIKLFAALRSLRYILLVSALYFFYKRGLPGDQIPIIFTICEVILFFPALLAVLIMARPIRGAEFFIWMRRHFHFGYRGMLSGVFSEINTRVDVLMLGLFAGDAIVGVYSLGAMFAEGLNQLPVLFRANFNPVLAQKFAKGDLPGIVNLVRRGRLIAYLLFAPLFAIGVALFPFVIEFIGRTGEFEESWLVFGILSVGMYAASGYSPFQNLLIQAGAPGRYTIMVGTLVLTNIAFNAGLIPMLGINGAAIATTATFVFSVFYLKYFTKRYAKIVI